MDRFRRTNPSVSRIITSRMQQRQHEFLKKRLANVKSTYNVRNLKLKRVKNRKKAQMDEDRNILIDKDNKILLRRMEEISLTPQTDCHLHRRAAQTNYGHRVLYVNQLNEDNLRMFKRIQRTHPVYSHKQWEEERKAMLHRISYMSEYTSDGQPKNFMFGISNPRSLKSHSKSGKSHTNSSSSSAAASGLSKRPSTVAAGGSRRRRRGANESSSSKASTSSGSGMRRVASSGARLSSTRRRRGGKKRGARKQPAGGRSMHEGDSDVLQPLAAVGSGGGGGSGSRVSAAGSAATAASSTNDGVLHAAAPSQLDTDDHDNTPVAGSAQPDSLPPLTAGGGAGGGAGAGASRKDVPPVDLGSLSKEEQQRLGDLKHAELSPVRIV